MAKIFEPFFTTKPTGSGIGLTTSYSIIKHHGGHIELESEPGRGATFQVFLPAAAEPPQIQNAPAQEVLSARGRLLVMDDEEYVRRLAESSMRYFGHHADTAQDSLQTIDCFRRAMNTGQPYDLVILDLTIAGGAGGIETLRELRKPDPDVRAIASSGYASDPVISNPLLYGFCAALAKPYSMQEIRSVIARLLAGKSDTVP